MCTCTWDISTKLYIIAQYTTTVSFAFAKDTVVVFCAICIVYTFGMIGVYYSTLRSLLFAGTNFSGFHDSLI